jgi:hypothetical protein
MLALDLDAVALGSPAPEGSLLIDQEAKGIRDDMAYPRLAYPVYEGFGKRSECRIEE